MTTDGGGVCVFGAGHIGTTLYCDIKSYRGDRAVTVIRHGPPSVVGPFVMRDILTGETRHVTVDPDYFVEWTDQAAIGAALRRSAVVIVAVPDIPRLRAAVMEMMRRFIGGAAKHVVFMRAGQGGAPSLARALAHGDCAGWDCLLVEDAFYGTRVARNTVEYKRKASMAVAYYGWDPDACHAAVRALFAPGDLGVFIGKTPLALAFDPLGYYIHTAVCLDPDNIALTRAGRTYLHYSEGISESTAELLDAMDRERVALARAYEIDAERFPDILWRQYGHKPGATFHATMRTTGMFYRSRSPGSVAELRASRSLHEDIPALYTMLGMADAVGDPMPGTRAFARSLPARLATVGMTLADIETYPWPADLTSAAAVRSLVDRRVVAAHLSAVPL